MEIDKKNKNTVKDFLFDYCNAVAFVEETTACEADEAFLINVAMTMVEGGWNKGKKEATVIAIKKK